MIHQWRMPAPQPTFRHSALPSQGVCPLQLLASIAMEQPTSAVAEYVVVSMDPEVAEQHADDVPSDGAPVDGGGEAEPVPEAPARPCCCAGKAAAAPASVAQSGFPMVPAVAVGALTVAALLLGKIFLGRKSSRGKGSGKPSSQAQDAKANG
jgi:hypothetical protein